MTDFILYHEGLLRLMSFLVVLIILAYFEVKRARRKVVIPKRIRWLNNLLLGFFNTFVLKILFPASAVGVAFFAEIHHIGLFNYFKIPYWIALVVSFIALDCLIYWQHVLFHAFAFLWRFHRMHHSDLEFDVTTAIRFHPIELILSMFIKATGICLIGAPPLAVVIFEILLNSSAMFNHSNIKLPLYWDRILRWIIVTPDMHRVHHSHRLRETQSNFGFNLPWWDYLFKTYCAAPKAGHEKMKIGIKNFHDPNDCIRLWGMLKSPLIPPNTTKL